VHLLVLIISKTNQCFKTYFTLCEYFRPHISHSFSSYNYIKTWKYLQTVELTITLTFSVVFLIFFFITVLHLRNFVFRYSCRFRNLPSAFKPAFQRTELHWMEYSWWKQNQSSQMCIFRYVSMFSTTRQVLSSLYCGRLMLRTADKLNFWEKEGSYWLSLGSRLEAYRMKIR
jgi:hypothetical protein